MYVMKMKMFKHLSFEILSKILIFVDKGCQWIMGLLAEGSNVRNENLYRIVHCLRNTGDPV